MQVPIEFGLAYGKYAANKYNKRTLRFCLIELHARILSKIDDFDTDIKCVGGLTKRSSYITRYVSADQTLL